MRPSVTLRLFAVVLPILMQPACRPSANMAQLQPKAGQSVAHYPGKLVDGVTPRLYDVHLTLDPNAQGFTGVVDIAVDLREAQRTLYLHAEDLHFDEVYARAPDGRARSVHVTPDKTPGLIALTFSSPLPEGVTTLHFSYHAAWGQGLLGIYRVNSNGQNYIFSQFEPIAARRALPCFDEPRFKAPFEVSLSVPKDSIVSSNGALMAEQTAEGMGDGDFKTVVFDPTPPLPTYLLAVAVGPMDVRRQDIGVSPLRPYPLPFQAMATRGNGEKLKIALGLGASLVQSLEAYTDLAYPFAKLDMLAVPDFAWGAMENAAHITFRDWLLLLDGPRASYGQRRVAYSVMAHELTHQWFGNWVTMPWWDDLWLNEAFATWRGTRTAQQLRPQMGFDLELIEGMGNAMHHDRLQHVRRVREPCRNRDDIYNAADVITYQKGAGILGMFEHLLGPEKIRDGVRAYLKSYSFGTASSSAFLQSLSRAADEPALIEAMQSFLDQPGVPEVSMSWECQDGQAQLQLSQERYRPLGGDAPGGLWRVPVCYRWGRGSSKQRACTMLNEASMTVPLRGGCPQWFVANAQGAGYYRTRASGEAMAASTAAVVQKRLSSTEMLAFVDNTAAAFSSGSLPAEVVLQLLQQSLAHEAPRVVLRAASHIDTIFRQHIGSQVSPAATARLVGMLRPAYARLDALVRARGDERGRRASLGSDSDAASDKFGEAVLARKGLQVALAGTAHDADIRAQLAHQGVAWLNDFEAQHRISGQASVPLPAAPKSAAVDNELIDLALAVAADSLGQPFFARLEQALQQESGGESRRRLVNALAQVQSPALAQQVRQMALRDSIHINEILSLLQPQMSVATLRNDTWRFVQDNFDALLARLAAKDAQRLLSMAASLCSAEAADALQLWLTTHQSRIPGGIRAAAQALETMHLCVAEDVAQSAAVRAYFN